MAQRKRGSGPDSVPAPNESSGATMSAGGCSEIGSGRGPRDLRANGGHVRRPVNRLEAVPRPVEPQQPNRAVARPPPPRKPRARVADAARTAPIFQNAARIPAASQRDRPMFGAGKSRRRVTPRRRTPDKIGPPPNAAGRSCAPVPPRSLARASDIATPPAMAGGPAWRQAMSTGPAAGVSTSVNRMAHALSPRHWRRRRFYNLCNFLPPLNHSPGRLS